MATVTENRTIRMDIPQVVEGVFFALESEDYEELTLLKKEFYNSYDQFTETLKPHVRVFLRNYISANELDPIKDLNNFFLPVLSEK